MLAQKLGGLLRKDFDERSEDDRLIIERILILVRNILEVWFYILYRDCRFKNYNKLNGCLNNADDKKVFHNSS